MKDYELGVQMDLVIDANIIISALLSTEGKTFDLIFNDKLRLFAPKFLLEEIKKHKAEILKKSGLEDNQLSIILDTVSSRIDFMPKQDFRVFINKAKRISPDPNDTEYFALALKQNCPIWSNDKKLKNQNEIVVYSTNDLVIII